MNAAKQTDEATTPQHAPAIPRITLAGLAFAVCYLLVYIVPSNVLPALGADLGWTLTAAGAMVALGTGWLAWTMAGRASAEFLSRVVIGAVTGGLVAFALSALTGPVVYITKPNHGVLVGLYVAAPVGALVGGLIGGIVWARRPRAVMIALVLALATTALACEFASID